MPGAKAAFAPLPPAPISVPGFEGPFELLLRLLDGGEMEITAVSLLAVTEQYLDFLRLLPGNAYRLDCLAEFLVVGAQLLVLKSRALLPRPEPALAEEAPLDEESLEARLAEYRRYREAAGRLRERQERGQRAFARQGPAPLPPPGPPPRLEHGVPEQLAAALQRLLAARAPAAEPLAPPRVTLGQRIEQVRQAVADYGAVSFSWLAGGCESRAELILTFLAVLELFRAGLVRLEQGGLFDEIWLRQASRAGGTGAGEVGPRPPAEGTA
ncbi:MAG TPA: ScpA family protein [Chloroflexota bacterium]|nr:ScpA family protein [Chloroflexota bacterium]